MWARSTTTSHARNKSSPRFRTPVAERAHESGPGEQGPGAPEDLSAFGPRIPIPAGRNLTQAVVTAAVLIVIAIACYLGGPDYFFWLAAVVVAGAAFELLDAVKRSGRRPFVAFGPGCVLALMLAAYFRPARPEILIAVVTLAVFGSFLLALIPGRKDAPATDVGWMVLTVTWIGGGGAAAVSILALPNGLNLLVAHVLVTALDDIGAYFAGTRFGRHKMVPSISPAKSWEGFAGGLAVALIGGIVAGLLIDELGPLHGLAIGAINGLLAPVGDLAESMAKRELGIKDSGRMLPGHGGFLDRLDAIIFCAPAVLGYIRVVVL
jgi:phosphatidate cytidylyltransferase